MNLSDCSQQARESIENEVKLRLAQHSNFACSICGAIPIVFHHIEEWAKHYSNEERFLITICDSCHRLIHGKGGSVFSKDELYFHKANPKRPLKIMKQLPLDKKKVFPFLLEVIL